MDSTFGAASTDAAAWTHNSNIDPLPAMDKGSHGKALATIENCDSEVTCPLGDHAARLVTRPARLWVWMALRS